MAITINSNPTPQLDLPINTVVQLDTGTVGSTYSWTVLDQPAEATSTLSASDIKNPTITPDVYGSYTLRCVIDGTTEEYAMFAVLSQRNRQRIPAAGEGDPALGGALAGTRSWAEDVNKLVRYHERNAERGALEICQASEALTKGNVVYVSGEATVNASLPGEHVVPLVAKADASSGTTLGAVGVVLGKAGLESDSASSGELVVVVFRGLVHSLNTDGSSVNAPVYVSDTEGEFSFAAGSNEFEIGRVAKVDASVGSIHVYPKPTTSGGGSALSWNYLDLSLPPGYTGSIEALWQFDKTANGFDDRAGNDHGVTSSDSYYQSLPDDPDTKALWCLDRVRLVSNPSDFIQPTEDLVCELVLCRADYDVAGTGVIFEIGGGGTNILFESQTFEVFLMPGQSAHLIISVDKASNPGEYLIFLNGELEYTYNMLNSDGGSGGLVAIGCNTSSAAFYRGLLSSMRVMFGAPFTEADAMWCYNKVRGIS
jgi:hypothetical protein